MINHSKLFSIRSAFYLVIILLLSYFPNLESKEQRDVNIQLIEKISKAIDLGTENILKLQNADGSFSRMKGGGAGGLHKGGSSTALCLYTILSSRLPKNEDLRKRILVAADKGFDYMRQKHYIPGTTYANGILLMALEKRIQYNRPKPEVGYSSKEKKSKVELDLKWMEDITAKIIATKCEKKIVSLPKFKNSSGDPVEIKLPKVKGKYKAEEKEHVLDFTGWSWGYPNSHGGFDHQDLSNTQYAVLGIAAAYRAGVKVDKEVFWKILHFGLYSQEPNGSRVTRYELDQKAVEKEKKQAAEQIERDRVREERRIQSGRKESTRERTERLEKEKQREYEKNYDYVGVNKYRKNLKKAKVYDEARGWDYCKKSNPTASGAAYGSMTTAGLACILTAHMGLDGDELYDGYYKELVSQSIYDGIGWLGMTFSTTQNPNASGRHQKWVYYYLYGMERVGMMAGLEHFGQVLWYNRGAEYLVSAQNNDGSWKEPYYETCFAVLFLSRATKPANFTKKKKYHISE